MNEPGMRNVRVEEITGQDAHGDFRHEAFLGGGRTMASDLTHGIETDLQRRANRSFRITWNGTVRTPKNVVIGGHPIGWTQHGRVKNRNGDIIGTYQRLLDGGDDGLTHEMTIFLNA